MTWISGPSTAVPASAMVTTGSSGSLLVMVRMPAKEPVSGGAKVTARGYSSRPPMSRGSPKQVKAVSSLRMEEISSRPQARL